MSNLMVQEFQGKSIRFETREDGRVWGCLTDMAKATGKKVSHYLDLPDTKQLCDILHTKSNVNSEQNFIAVISAMKAESYFQDLIIVIKGGDVSKSGTWAVEEVMIDFAYWANMEFRLWVIGVVQKLRSEGVAMTPKVTAEAIAKEWGLQGKSPEQLLWELNTLLSKQDALKFGAAYHGHLINIRSAACYKVLCEETKNDKLWSKINDLAEQRIEEYRNSEEFPQEFWEQFYDSQTRQYWISQWKNGQWYKTYLNNTVGN